MRITATAAGPVAEKQSVKIATDRKSGADSYALAGSLLAMHARFLERQKMLHRQQDIGEARPNYRLLPFGQHSAFSKSSDNLVVNHL